MKKEVGPEPSELDKKVVAWLNNMKPGLGDDLRGYTINRHVGEVGLITLELFFNTDQLEEKE